MIHSALDYAVVWLPVAAFLFSFFVVALVISRGKDRIGNFHDFTRIFLAEGATLKTWGLFIAGFTMTLLLSGVIAVMATAPSWSKDGEVLLAVISFFKSIAIGLEVLLAIVLGSFGAVAFKGQGPGGVSFELDQDGPPSVAATMTGPAPTKSKEAGEKV